MGSSKTVLMKIYPIVMNVGPIEPLLGA